MRHEQEAKMNAPEENKSGNGLWRLTKANPGRMAACARYSRRFLWQSNLLHSGGVIIMMWHQALFKQITQAAMSQQKIICYKPPAVEELINNKTSWIYCAEFGTWASK